MIDYNSKEKMVERVAIAQDALAWIQAGALIPRSFVYVRPEKQPDHNYTEFRLEHMQLRDIVLGKCEVCAKGALFLAKAVRYDNVRACDWRTSSDDYDGAALRQHFSREQLKLIESAFEGWDYYPGTKQFHDRFDTPTDRLIAILENIIANDGTFIINSEGM